MSDVPYPYKLYADHDHVYTAISGVRVTCAITQTLWVGPSQGHNYKIISSPTGGPFFAIFYYHYRFENEACYPF